MIINWSDSLISRADFMYSLHQTDIRRSKFYIVSEGISFLTGSQTKVYFSKQRLKLENFDNLLFVVLEIGLRLSSLILNSNFIIELSCQLFGVQCSKILLLTVHHKEDLPRVTVLGDPAELGTAEVVNVCSFEHFLMRLNYDLLIALSAQ